MCPIHDIRVLSVYFYLVFERIHFRVTRVRVLILRRNEQYLVFDIDSVSYRDHKHMEIYVILPFCALEFNVEKLLLNFVS